MARSYDDTPRVCVFCGSEGPLTDEHALAQWARKTLGITRRGRVDVVQGCEVVRTARGLRVIAHQRLCEPCNSDWLSGYEDRFKRQLGAAITGFGPLTLDGELQDFAALWVIKTGLLLELAVRHDRGPIRLPASVFRWLHEKRSSPPGSAAWLGATGPKSGERPRAGFFANQVVASSADGGRLANILTFFIGNLVMKCLVTDVPGGEVTVLTPIATSPNFIQIRPVLRDPVTWPPTPLTYEALESPTMMFAPVRVPPDLQRPLPDDFAWPADFV